LGERLKSQMETFAAAASPTGLASAAALSEPGASAHFPLGSVI
jgi:nicotinamide mononucleotide (NMN) deamidase PncC